MHSEAPIGDKMEEGQQRWFGHVQQRTITAPVKSDMVQVEGLKGQGKGQKRVGTK